MINLFKKAEAANNSKYKNFYNEVESLYNNLKQKYDPNTQHDSIFKARGIKNGNKIVITAETKDGGVIKDSVTINEEPPKPLETKAVNPIDIEPFNIKVNVDDFDEEGNDVDSISSSETIEPGNANLNNNEKIISPEENAVNDYVEIIEKIYNLSDYILNKIETIDAVKLGRIQPTENTEKFTNKIYKIIEVFQNYILNVFSNIDTINGNIIYNNIFDIIKKNGHKNELIDKQTHFINSKNKFNGNYKNPNIYKDFQSILQQEKEFLRIINGDCKYLYDIIIQNKNMINEKYIDVYTSANEKIIENINKKIHDDKEGFNALYKIIFLARPSSAPSGSYTNPNIMGSNNENLEVSKDDNNIPIKTIVKSRDFNEDKSQLWRGGSIYKHKKYTKKRNPNKKYTISRKLKNARLNKTRNRNIRNKNKTRINKYI